MNLTNKLSKLRVQNNCLAKFASGMIKKKQNKLLNISTKPKKVKNKSDKLEDQIYYKFLSLMEDWEDLSNGKSKSDFAINSVFAWVNDVSINL